MGSAVFNPRNLRPPFNPSAIVDMLTGKATSGPGGFDLYLRNLTSLLPQIAGYNVGQYGPRGDGSTDDQPDFQEAINDVLNAGGGTLTVPVGNFALKNPLVIPATMNGQPSPPITIVGSGPGTVLMRAANLPAGQGLLDVYSSKVSIQGFTIDGQVTTPVGLQYGHDFNTATHGANDPMASSLTTNTSIWLHGPLADFSMLDVTIQHTGGYGVLVDAGSGVINNVQAVLCNFLNNRPCLFGTAVGQLIYGSWGGGLYVNGNGTTAGSGVLHGLLVALCRFLRNDGNCVWSHLYGLTELHTDFRIIGNYFEECGLDAIEPGGVSGGVVGFNAGRRVGYVTVDDTSRSTPRWLAGALNATAIDSSGLVKSVPYVCNSFVSVNGGFLDLDGHCDSAVTGNVCRIPLVGEPEYVEDQIAITGPNNAGSNSYGVNMNNSQNTPWGAQNVEISGNTFLNLSAGSIRLFAARNCIAEGNLINAPANAIEAPVTMGPVGSGPNQRCYDNKICHNRVIYDPGSALPVVKEIDGSSPFTGSEANYVFGNCPITPSSSPAIEFQPSGTSGSPTYAQTVWFP